MKIETKGSELHEVKMLLIKALKDMNGENIYIEHYYNIASTLSTLEYNKVISKIEELYEDVVYNRENIVTFEDLAKYLSTLKMKQDYKEKIDLTISKEALKCLAVFALGILLASVIITIGYEKRIYNMKQEVQRVYDIEDNYRGKDVK